MYLIIRKICEHQHSLQIIFNNIKKGKNEILNQIKSELSNLNINEQNVKHFDLENNSSFFTEYMNNLVIMISQVILFVIGKGSSTSKVYDSLVLNVSKMFDFFIRD